MIPKVIHYTWFSGEELPAFVKECMRTWKKHLPDYKLRLWDANALHSIHTPPPFALDTYRMRSWAPLSDYVRLYALYTEGGIYLDTDVKVCRSFDEFLHYNFFSNHEIYHNIFDRESEQAKLNPDGTIKDINNFVNCFFVQGAIMGSIPGLPFLKDCLDHYKNVTYDLETHTPNDYIIGDHITPLLCKYGYRFVDEDQLLQDNMMIKNSSVFVGDPRFVSKNPYAIHLCSAGWKSTRSSFRKKLRNRLPWLYNIYFAIVSKFRQQ